MYKNIFIAVFSLGVLGFISYSFLPSELSNKIERKGVEYFDGHYAVTYTDDTTRETWEVKGKVTSSEKGYYYFWDSRKRYVQVPIQRTYLVEIK